MHATGPGGEVGLAAMVFRDGSLPPPELPRRRTFIRATALFAIAVTAAYLVWRLTSTIALDWWWVAIPLFVAEVHNAIGLVLYAIALWDVDAANLPAAATTRRRQRVAVLIPTYNEPPDVLLPTISAAVALKPKHETWVLDDGHRDEIRELAETLGARYLTRPSNEHAKAGNLNHALQHIDADIIGVLDADHVPTARFLTALLPYFDDPTLAFVQSPQDFYNLESFEHQRRRNGEVFNEEAVFYRVIAPAKNCWSAPFWCGTCAMIRVEALRSVGGVSTDSVTEDIHTTIRMYRRGWTGAYHNEVLARGLAPDDASGYLLQRNRWAIGAMQVLRRENPLSSSGLTIGQRLAFATTLFGWFDSWRTLTYILIPLAVVATGACPDRRPGRGLRSGLPGDARDPILRDAIPVARPVPATPVHPLRVHPDAGRHTSDAGGLLARPGIEVQGHAQGAQRDQRSARPGAPPAVRAGRRVLAGDRLVHCHPPRALTGHLQRAVGGHRRSLLHGAEPRVAARRDPAHPILEVRGEPSGGHPPARPRPGPARRSAW